MLETESIADEFCSQVSFFCRERIAFCFYLLQFGMRGAQHQLEFRGIGVNVHLPAESLRARFTWPLLSRVAKSSAPLAVNCQHVQMGEDSLGLVREFLE